MPVKKLSRCFSKQIPTNYAVLPKNNSKVFGECVKLPEQKNLISVV